MSTEDPEALLAQALRAKAGREGADLLPAAGTSALPAPVEEAPEPLPVRWLLLLALTLGLAAGAVAGLLTLL